MTPVENIAWKKKTRKVYCHHTGLFEFPRVAPESMADLKPVWAAAIERRRLEIFVRCVNCARIQRISKHVISPGGRVNWECIHCNHCHGFFYALLLGWPGSKALLKSQIRKQNKERGKHERKAKVQGR